ncbi:MAG: lipid-A-disaccharide synthase [Bacteroidetes bacterium]|nr:lipid-A-disaccharide synthase [Bacteroidota bacterium]
MKFYIIAGEASGDLHASNLIKELKKLHPAADFRGWGGDMMQAQGVTLVKHYRELAFMGFKEVLMNLSAIIKNIKFCKEDIKSYNPDAIIFVDYPGFNLRIAKWAKAQNYKTIYYISPQIWAWKESRVTQIKRNIDLMLCILPFEKDFYKKHGMDVVFTGHPLLDVVKDFNTGDSFFKENNLNADKQIIALLPGSRKQEIKTMLPVMMEVANEFPEAQFVVAGAPAQDGDFYDEVIKITPIKLIQNQTYALLSHATAALVTSGTATLETALFGVPEVVCYKGGNVSYRIARLLVKIKFISLVNLIAGKEIVKELIQNDFNKENCTAELRKLLTPSTRLPMIEELNKIKDMLGGSGASARAAKEIMSQFENEK